MADDVCRWHGCNRRISEPRLGCTVQPRGFTYHWACIRDLVNNGEIAMYTDYLPCAQRERHEMMKFANMADAKIAAIKRRDGNITTRR